MINPTLFLLCHLVGDYLLQTPWMALNKYTKTLPCLVHVLIYTSCFLLLTMSWKALLFIGVTHFILDRFPDIVRSLIWWKNHIPTGKYPLYEYCDTTGYFDDSPHRTCEKPEYPKVLNEKALGKQTPYFISIWLYIITDNTLHLIFNYVALSFL